MSCIRINSLILSLILVFACRDEQLNKIPYKKKKNTLSVCVCVREIYLSLYTYMHIHAFIDEQ